MSSRCAVVREAVALGCAADDALRSLSQRASAASSQGVHGEPIRDVRPALALARELGRELPTPGGGETLRLWESLATLGAVDLTVARVVEPHLDALAIIAEASRDGVSAVAELGATSVWGVFAAEGGPRLKASLSGAAWTLSGSKPWCSLSDQVSHALITAWVDEHRRCLFAVDMSHLGVRQVDDTPWVARGLARVRSAGLQLTEVPAVPVGEPGWYLQRPGFAWGGAGVAAIWYGAAVQVARRVRTSSLQREPDQIALTHLGAIDVALTRARAVLLAAARVVDGPLSAPQDAARLALRVRQVVVDSAEEILGRAAHTLGPGPLALEEDHARRTADLELYVRQHHAERDTAALGRTTLTDPKQADPSAAEWVWW